MNLSCSTSLSNFVFLHLCRGEGPYRAGERISGTVTYDFTKCINRKEWKLKSLQAIYVVCRGRAEISEVDEIPGETECILDDKISLYTRARGSNLKQIHNQKASEVSSYPFTIYLPNELPISFQDENCEIYYKISVVLSFGKDMWNCTDYPGPSLPFLLTRKINLRFNPQAQCSGSTRDYKTWSRIGLIKLNWRRGSLKYRICINQRGFIPGETVSFNLYINNNTNKEIDFVKIFVREDFLRDFRGSIILLKSKEFNPQIGNTITPFSDGLWNGDLDIPTNVISSAINCDLLRVEHYIVVEMFETAKSSIGKSEKLLLRGKIQIFIGDIGIGTTSNHNRTSRSNEESPHPPSTSCHSRRRRHRRHYWSRSPPKYDTIMEEFELDQIHMPPPTYAQAMEYLNNNNDNDLASPGPSQSYSNPCYEMLVNN